VTCASVTLDPVAPAAAEKSENSTMAGRVTPCAPSQDRQQTMMHHRTGGVITSYGGVQGTTRPGK